jgi:hypothetical protein
MRVSTHPVTEVRHYLNRQTGYNLINQVTEPRRDSRLTEHVYMSQNLYFKKLQAFISMALDLKGSKYKL